jgi:hypothetical protein
MKHVAVFWMNGKKNILENFIPEIPDTWLMLHVWYLTGSIGSIRIEIRGR